MTYELFLKYLEIYAHTDNVEKYFELWEKYPEYTEKLICQSKDNAHESWEKFKAMMREEYGEDFI